MGGFLRLKCTDMHTFTRLWVVNPRSEPRFSVAGDALRKIIVSLAQPGAATIRSEKRTSPDIFSRRNDFEVIRVAARTRASSSRLHVIHEEVVELHPVWDWPAVDLPGEAMDADILAFDV